MEAQKVDMFMMSNAKFFEGHQLNAIRERLLQMDDNKWPMVQTLQFKDPTTALLISILQVLTELTVSISVIQVWELENYLLVVV